jgi:hypothetical protein
VFNVRDLEKDLELCEKRTPGPVKWQKFGKQYYLTGQYGMRPVIFATIEESYKFTHISNRDAESNLLIPLNPNHPDSRFVEEAWESLPYWLGEVKRLREALGGEEVADWAVEAVECRKETARANLGIIKLRAENQRLKEALNAINNLAVGWREIETGRAETWATVDEIYKLSLLPEEGKG